MTGDADAHWSLKPHRAGAGVRAPETHQSQADRLREAAPGRATVGRADLGDVPDGEAIPRGLRLPPGDALRLGASAAGQAGVLRYEVGSRTPFERDSHGAFGGYDCWGWGFAALSRWFRGDSEPNWVLANSAHVDPYYRQLDEGRIPIERGFRYTEVDLR